MNLRRRCKVFSLKQGYQKRIFARKPQEGFRYPIFRKFSSLLMPSELCFYAPNRNIKKGQNTYGYLQYEAGFGHKFTTPLRIF